MFPRPASDPIRVGPYTLTECIGQGGMAVVYKAKRQGPAGFEKTVVVKAMALVQIARVMQVGLSEVLPWRRLALIAVNAGVPLAPAWAVMDITSEPIVMTAALSVAVYGLAYAAMWYVLHVHLSVLVAPPPRAVTVAAPPLQQEM